MSAVDVLEKRLTTEEGERPTRTKEQRLAGNARAMKWLNNNRELRNARSKARYYAKKPEIRVIQRRYEQQCMELARTDKIRHAKYLTDHIRPKARKRGIPFNITFEDIPIPEVCPVLGIRLVMNRGRMQDDSASVDRIKPELGYVKGNVIVVSLKANRIKTNATPDELMRVAIFYERYR